MNQIKWKYNAHYFFALSRSKFPEPVNVNTLDARVSAYNGIINSFIAEYNCTINRKDGTMKCSEEDYIMIKLSCPKAVLCP